MGPKPKRAVAAVALLLLVVLGYWALQKWNVSRGAYNDRLRVAARKGDLDGVRGLLRKGVDVDARLTVNNTAAIHWAAEKGGLDMVAFLVERGADVNITDDRGMTPLHFAGRRDVAEYLVRQGADIDATTNIGLTPLHMAAVGDHGEVAAYLVSLGMDIEARSNEGMTPLHLAAMGGSVGVAEYLVGQGADINAVTSTGTTALSIAKTDEVRELLIEHGAKAVDADDHVPQDEDDGE